jgi:hypothetical protein
MHRQIFIVSMLVFCGMFAYVFAVSAYVRSSTNYIIQSDSINSGGTDESQSASYKAWDTVGEVGTGDSGSTNFRIRAGYRQVDDYYISMTPGGDVNLSPNLSGLSGGSATGSAIWKVSTDNIAGYNMTIRATGSPAMKAGSETIADYTPATGGVPDYNWNIVAANSEFGFSPYNVYSQAAKYKNNTSNCNIGSTITDQKCWYGLSTSNETITNKTGRTDVAGEDTRINFKAEINTSTGFQMGGNYKAVIVVTAAGN